MPMFSPDSPQGPNGQTGGDLHTSVLAADSEGEFVVDKILAQARPENKNDDEGDVYLVRWEGYPVEQCTWEPKESFLGRETMEQWERDKLQGQILSQDEVDEIVRKMDLFAEANEERGKRKRTQKEQLASNRKSTSAIASKANKNLAVASRLELHGSPDSVGDRLAKTHENAATTASNLSEHLDGLILPQTNDSGTKSYQGMAVEARARRSSYCPLWTGPKEKAGTHFKTLRTQHRHQKAGKNEPAPDLGQIKLKSVTDIVAAAGEDVAHILPPGSPQPIAGSVDQLDPVMRQYDSVSANSPQNTHTPNNNISTAIINKRRDVHHLPNGRYWLFGEVLLHLTIHEQEVGDVRVRGLPNWFKSKLISLKVEHQILVDFHLVEMEQYDALCTGRSNDLIANAYFAPFEDSQAAVAELADSLEYKNRAALWYHPDTLHVLIAYAAASNDWQFLDGGYAFPPECKIHLALRNSMPKIETLVAIRHLEGRPIPPGSGKAMAGPRARLTSPETPTPSVNMNIYDAMTPRIAEKGMDVNFASPNIGSRSMPSSKFLSNLSGTAEQIRLSDPSVGVMAKADDFQDSEILLHEDSTNLRLVGNNAESEDEYSGPSTESEKRSKPPFEFRFPTGQNIDTAFQNQFGISYELLTQPSVIPTSRKEMLDPGRARFYLAFPLSYQAELEVMWAFLSNHTLPNIICTSVDPQGWDGFKTILGDNSDHIGVIIFHEKYTNYSGLPGLAKLLKMVNVNLFNVSLRQVLPFCDSPVHIERLFPNGTAILLTESVMMQQPEQTLAILRWFSNTVKTKRGTWKIVLIPNVRHWLRHATMHAEGSVACFLEMLMEISELSLGQPATYRRLADEESEAESLDGRDDEFGKGCLVVSPANIPAYDRCRRKGNIWKEAEDKRVSIQSEKVLIEWFAGWAVMNAQRHRKFPAISGMAPIFSNLSDQWGHIEVVNPDRYMLQNRIPFQRPSSTDTLAQSLG